MSELAQELQDEDETGRLSKLAQQQKHQMQLQYAEKNLNMLTEEAA